MNGVELVTSWFTPTVLFCVLNLMIGTLFITSSLIPQKTHSNPRDDNDEHDHHPQLIRVPSLFERVKSINLSRYRSVQPDPAHEAEPEPEPKPEIEHSHVARSKSDTVTEAVKNIKKPAARVLKKCFSEKLTTMVQMKWWEDVKESNEQRRPATARDKTSSSSGAGGEDVDEAVDAKADDFINRFKQQLKLQRLDSILRYKEMLNRGMGR